MIGILQRYTAWHVARSLAITWLILTSVVMTVLLGDEADELWRNHASLQQTFTYLACVLPQKTFIVFPAICLMGSLFGMLTLSRHNELSAMYAAGASLRWLIRPTLVLSLFLGFGCYLWNETVAAPLSRWGEQMMMTDIKKKKGIFKDYGLLKGTKNRFIQYGDFTRDPTPILTDVVLHEMRADGRGHTLLVRADIAYWDPDAIHPVTGKTGVWWLGANSLDSENYRIFTPDDWTEEIEAIEEGDILDIEETPDNFGVFERKPIEMSYRELDARIKKIALEGYSGEDLLPDLEFKRAVPFSVVALMVIGMASGASTFLLGREGAARFTYPLGICLIVLGCYYAVTFVCLGLGKMGHLAPMVSAWFPIVFFGGVGLFMLYRER